MLHICSALRNLQSGLMSVIRLLNEQLHSRHLAHMREAQGHMHTCEHAPGCAGNAMPWSSSLTSCAAPICQQQHA